MYKYYKTIYPRFTYYYRVLWSRKHDMCKFCDRIIIVGSFIEKIPMNDYITKQNLKHYIETDLEEWNNQLLKIL